MPTRTILVPAVLAALATAAGGQTVYRCGNSYVQQPCPGGTAVDVTDKVGPGDAARAGKAAAADAQRAEAMEKARLAQEKNAPKAVVIAPVAAASAPEGKAKSKKSREPEHFTAKGPAPAKKKD